MTNLRIVIALWLPATIAFYPNLSPLLQQHFSVGQNSNFPHRLAWRSKTRLETCKPILLRARALSQSEEAELSEMRGMQQRYFLLSFESRINWLMHRKVGIYLSKI